MANAVGGIETANRPAPESGALRLRTVDSREAWSALRPAWEGLIQRSREPSIFQTWEWLDAWIEVFLGDRSLHVLVLEEDDGKLLAAAPLYRSESGTLRLLADEYACSDYLDFPAVADREPEAAAELARRLDAGDCEVLALDAVADDAFLRRELLPLLTGRHGFHSLQLRTDVCPRLSITPQFKGAYNRKFKKLQKAHDADPRRQGAEEG